MGGLALGAQETHPGERVGWQLARIAPLGDVPRAPSSFHCVIDGSPALSLDHVSTGIGLFDHQQFFVKDIDYGAGNGVESRLAEPSVIFQEIPSNEPKTYFMVTCCPNIESREPHFVTSMTAPVASGWSGCRVGLAPTWTRLLAKNASGAMKRASARSRAAKAASISRLVLALRT